MIEGYEGRVYSEVYSIIECMGEKYKSAIPTKIYKQISDSRDMNYHPEFDMNQSLKSQGLSKGATTIVCFLHYKYWCESEEEKEKIGKILEHNQKKNAQKYDVNNIFNKKNSEIDSNVENNVKQNQLVEYKEGIFKRILNRIKNFFGIGRK